MEAADLEILCRREKLMTLKLQEVDEITRQLAQAADRSDGPSVELLLSMREEPLKDLTEKDRSLRESLLRLPQRDAVRARELLEGGEAREDGEIPLTRQVAQFRRLLNTVRELDRRVSLRIGGSHSIYVHYK